MEPNQTEVAVVVPVFNARDHVALLIDSLKRLTSQNLAVEVCLVDNGSKDGSIDVLSTSGFDVSSFDDWSSSYAARNVAIQKTKAPIIAFTDSDCVVHRDWIINGVNYMIETGCEVVAGKVEFSFIDRNSGWEIRDALVNMDNEQSVRRGYAKTANLFVKREVFDSIGSFDSHATSGEDAEWTKRASIRGFKLGYCDNAIVYHPTRTAMESLVKSVRVGIGYTRRRASSTRAGLPYEMALLVTILRGFLPPNPFAYLRQLRRKGWRFPVARLMVPGWFCSIASSYGILLSCYKAIFKRRLTASVIKAVNDD